MGVCLSKRASKSLHPAYICGNSIDVEYFGTLLQKSRSAAATICEDSRPSTDSCESSGMTRFKNLLCFCNSFHSSSLFQGIDMLDGEQQLEAKIGICNVKQNGSISGQVEIHGLKRSSKLCIPFEITDDELKVPGPQNSPVTCWLTSAEAPVEQGELKFIRSSDVVEGTNDADVMVIDVSEVFQDDEEEYPGSVDIDSSNCQSFTNAQKPIWLSTSDDKVVGSESLQEDSPSFLRSNSSSASELSSDGTIVLRSNSSSSASEFFSAESMSRASCGSSNSRYFLAEAGIFLFEDSRSSFSIQEAAPSLLLEGGSTAGNSRRSSSDSLQLQRAAFGSPLSSPPPHAAEDFGRVAAFGQHYPALSISDYANGDSSDDEDDDTSVSDDGSTTSSDLFELDSLRTNNLSSAGSSIDPDFQISAKAGSSTCQARDEPRTHLIVYSSLGKRAKITGLSASTWMYVEPENRF